MGSHGTTVRSGDFSFASLRKHREDVQNKSRLSQPLGLNICHEICHGVFVQQGEGVSPMTYQYLTVYMVRTAKENGAFSDQKKLKTASKYGFHSLILTDASIQVLDSYTNVLRPSLKPQCEFVLVKRNGGQHSKLGDVLSKLVFDAIGKYSHPTC